ncbi:MAG: phosphatase PAP2 family protein [Chloroflexia bacterium]
MGGLDILIWLRQHAMPWLDLVMGGITYLGSNYFYLAALALLYWCVDVAGTMRLFVLLLSSVYLHEVLKELTAVERPITLLRSLLPSSQQPRFTETAGGFSFPSGHTQDAIVFWGYLAIALRKRWLTVVVPLIVLLMAFSRLYLGLHWPLDILGGMALGLLILWFGYIILRLLAGLPVQARFPATLLFGLLPPAFYLLFPTHYAAVSMGALCGAVLGHIVERRSIRFRVHLPFWQQVLKVVIGLAGALLLLVGGRLLLPAAPPAESWVQGAVPEGTSGFGILLAELPTFGLYALVGVWCTLLAPAVFRFLFGREEEGDAAL